jgi:hypothetical protein
MFWPGKFHPTSVQQIYPLLNYLRAGMSILVTGPPFAMCGKGYWARISWPSRLDEK